VEQLKGLNDYLTDAGSPPCTITSPIRRRVVILIETERPAFIFQDVDRFRKKKAPATTSEPEVHDPIPLAGAVFQWWCGDPLGGGGHWKNYHPHVCLRLEKELATNEGFKNCEVHVPIDGVRYSLKRLSRERPFDFVKQSNMQSFRENFLPNHVLTLDCGLFDDVDRVTGNCFVQFQNGNPKRRRPVRSVRRGETAGVELAGEPCNVCFSDTGFLTGCDCKHVICPSCCRAGLRIMVGDVSQTDHLMCGCLTVKDITALEGLARRADTTMQALVQEPPKDKMARREFETEVLQHRPAFTLDDRIPHDIFATKVNEWLEKVQCRGSGCKQWPGTRSEHRLDPDSGHFLIFPGTSGEAEPLQETAGKNTWKNIWKNIWNNIWKQLYRCRGLQNLGARSGRLPSYPISDGHGAWRNAAS